MLGLTPYRRGNQISRRDDIWDMRSIFEDFFNESFLPGFAVSGSIKADIRETDKNYTIDAEIPGARKEDIKLDLRDDTLTISVVHNEQVNEEKENYVRRERRYGSMSRSFYLENVKEDGIAAKYADGILTVTLPKTEGKIDKTRKIEIQ